MMKFWMDLEGIIHDLFEVCLHLLGGTKKNHEKPWVVIGSIMAEICTGHLLHTNPSVTAPRACLINWLLCSSALFIKLFLLQHTFHFLSIVWSYTEYWNLPCGFYKFRNTPSYQVKRDEEGQYDHYHKKPYNWDKPMTIDSTITLSFFRQSTHAPNNGSMVMLIFGLSRCHFN